ncbi:hypothetical protein PV326_005946 [Microctonus aethiopoides]|nr:hypothetical protein PV326_005946 [Microctonus aethiopoides]
MSILKRPINYVDLEEELEESFKADFKYQLENDAKLRAIEQNAPTYEHFRQMVNGAHLKPLERKDTDELTKVSWNLLMKKNSNENQQSFIKNSIISTTNKEFNSYIVSKSFEEFYKEWKKMDDIENKLNFLQLSRDLLPEIFQVEIPINILMEFLNVCLHALTIMENQRLTLIFVIDILASIAMRLEEMPLRMSSEDRNFDMDEETDYLLQPTDDAMRPIIKRNRRINACSRFFKHFFCGAIVFFLKLFELKLL